MPLRKVWQTADKELIRGCLQGDERCCKRLYELTSAVMFGLCLRYAGNRHDAEEMLQEGYIKVFRHLHQYRGDGSLEGWMRRIFINAALAFLRQKQRQPQFADTEAEVYEEHVWVDDLMSKLNALDLLKLVQSLPDGYRTVFNLYAIEGFSHQEIAGLLGISEGTSKSQLARARYQLQKMMADAHNLKHYARAL